MTNEALKKMKNAMSSLLDELDNIPNNDFYKFFVEKGAEFESINTDNFQVSFFSENSIISTQNEAPILFEETINKWNELNQYTKIERAA